MREVRSTLFYRVTMISTATPLDKVFLLSPANFSGVRARQLTAPGAQFAAAVAFRSESGVAIEDAFSFMSALYFRGKAAYVRRFASSPAAIQVIAPGFGLVPFGWTIDAKRFAKLARTPVDPASRSYRTTLERHARALAESLGPDCRVVLLGSVATGKYIDVLWPVFQERLLFPRCFAGLGDMSRGSIMLKASVSGEELDYVPIDGRRHRREANG
jgi:hypothetical protein